jgi:hypothetical protein
MAKRSKKTAAAEYDIGYGKPPKHTQFQPGQPRPPRKPKKPELPDMNAFLCEELSYMVEVPGRDGRTERLPMGRLLVRQMVTKAAKTGDLSQIWPKLPKTTAERDAPFSDVELSIVLRALEQMALEQGIKSDKAPPSVAPQDCDVGEA